MKNSILRRLTLLGATLGAGALLVACSDDDTVCTTAADCADGQLCQIEEGATEGICIDPVVPEGCSLDNPCEEGFVCEFEEDAEVGTCVEEGEETPECTENSECEGAGEFCIDEVCRVPFTWVSVVSDTTTAADWTTSNPGPDVDAIEVIRGGQSVWAQTVEGSRIGTVAGDGQTTNCSNPEAAIGSPRSMPTNGQNGTCALSGTSAEDQLRYYCLGGGDNAATAGYLTVSFGDDFYLVDGDVIRVWELAPVTAPGSEFGCENTSVNRNDAYSVFAGKAGASTSPINNENFLSVGSSQAEGGVFSFTFSDPDAE